MTSIPTATGLLRYGPTAEKITRKPWWMILDCGSDWFGLYSPWLTKASKPRWARVVDEARIFGNYVDRNPRLALLRPQYEAPAWGPHISIMRGEKPRVNIDVWRLHQKIGDCEWTIANTKRTIHYLDTVLMPSLLESQRACTSRRTRRTWDVQIAKASHRIQANEHAHRKSGKALRRLQEELRQLGSPFPSRSEIRFEFDHIPRTKPFLRHWWLDVFSETFGNIREFYGLSREPKVPYHLTLASCEEKS